MLHSESTQLISTSNIHLFVCVFVVTLLQLIIDSSSSSYEVEKDAVDTTDFLCLLDSANQLNCSWSFDKLNEDAQLSVGIRYTLHSLTELNSTFDVLCRVLSDHQPIFCAVSVMMKN